mgnify:CR=1 FL=1
MKIFAGPFAGLRYIDHSIMSAHYPKLLGTYEKELWPVFEELKEWTFTKGVVIGAGEGYYAVGIAKYLDIQVVAYEMDPMGPHLVRELAAKNQLEDQVHINGVCKPKNLLQLDTKKSYLFLFDAEGNEFEFYKAGCFEVFTNSWFIVEIHYPEHLAEFEKTLSSIFHFEYIPVKKRNMADFPLKLPDFLRYGLVRYWKSLVQEWRTSNSHGWMILKPKLQNQ